MVETVQTTWKARVVNGKLVLIDTATELPEGTELKLRVDDDEIADDLTESEMLELRLSLDEGGEVPAQEVIERLRQR